MAKKKVVKKKAVKKAVTKKPSAPKGPVIGKVSHYYDRIGVAVVALQATMKLGDKIALTHAGKTFTQKVASMQVNHTPLTVAHAGEEIGLKVDKVAGEGTKISAV